MVRNNNYINSSGLFTSNSSINLNKSALFNNNKLKKFKNYGSVNNMTNNINNLSRPSTAPHKGEKSEKEKNSKEKKRKQIIHHIHESKKGINNYNKNAIKLNLRPSSAQGKNNNYFLLKYN